SGEEAIATGISALLTSEDKVFGNHRSHGHFLAKGGSVAGLIGEVYCRVIGCSRGRGGSMHLIAPEVGFLGAAPIVAGTISLALGAALAHKIQGRDAVAVTYFGDGAAGEGVLYEAMNFASIQNLPLIFVCENNFYATHMPIRETRKKDTIYKSALPFGIEAVREDGNDVLKVYEAARRAVEMCRSGKGPYFLEFTTYRLRGHVGPDDNIQGNHTDIRPPDEVAEWRKKDPIPKFRKYLLETDIVEQKDIDAIDLDVEKEVAAAHQLVRESDVPRVEELNSYVFKKTVA
ncbi:MAG: thiamine pyrophosphate-dependent dehydrogenase E1 component subunit alpha, partial [Desulfuromusa sp.]|nr:thiamine pyrophosphate-dependent dehydrogenase E1 component subunit alpha [Desulfuromusa sp.]